MAQKLDGKTVAVLATDGFEQVELTEPVKALRDAGATVHVVAPKAGQIQGWNHHDRGDMVDVDVTLDQADAGRYDALLLPGGVRGKRMTSWPSLQTDLRNAGATWVDEQVVTDHGLVTSRKPDDIPAFCRKMIEEFCEGRHSGHRHAAA